MKAGRLLSDPSAVLDLDFVLNHLVDQLQPTIELIFFTVLNLNFDLFSIIEKESL